MEIDKRNGNVCFNDLNHCYFDINDNSKKYISVTTLIGKYEQPFDEDFWSKYKALEKLLPKESWNIEKKSLLNTKKFKKLKPLTLLSLLLVCIVKIKKKM